MLQSSTYLVCNRGNGPYMALNDFFDVRTNVHLGTECVFKIADFDEGWIRCVSDDFDLIL